jgi:hypothetical protein
MVDPQHHLDHCADPSASLAFESFSSGETPGMMALLRIVYKTELVASPVIRPYQTNRSHIS